MFRGKIFSFREGKMYFVLAKNKKHHNIILNSNLEDNENPWEQKGTLCLDTGSLMYLNGGLGITQICLASQAQAPWNLYIRKDPDMS